MVFMLIIWRGRGLLAFVALIPLLLCLGMFADRASPEFALLLHTGGLIAAGAICIHYGTRWNWDAVEHSCYFVPLHWWGWVYLFVAAGLALTGIIDATQEGLDDPSSSNKAVAGGFVVVLVLTTAWYLIRSVQQLQAAIAESLDEEDWASGNY